jgi:hypothetical protein
VVKKSVTDKETPQDVVMEKKFDDRGRAAK